MALPSASTRTRLGLATDRAARLMLLVMGPFVLTGLLLEAAVLSVVQTVLAVLA
jgi:hypothetical protein